MSDMTEKHTYTVDVDWTAEKKGMMNSPGLDDLEVATPPQFPGGHEGIWSPEHLYVASAPSCLMTTFFAIAGNSKLDYDAFHVSGKGTLEKVERGYEITRIDLYANVDISDERQENKAGRVLQKSEAACLISNSMKTEVVLHGNIRVKTA